jgi:hypothetical protein
LKSRLLSTFRAIPGAIDTTGGHRLLFDWALNQESQIEAGEPRVSQAAPILALSGGNAIWDDRNDLRSLLPMRTNGGLKNIKWIYSGVASRAAEAGGAAARSAATASERSEGGLLPRQGAGGAPAPAFFRT